MRRKEREAETVALILPLYRKYGSETDCHIELFDAAHAELPEMRKLILEWMDRYLIDKTSATQ